MILVRNENFREYITKYPITSFIVLLNTLVFIYTSLNGGFLNGKFANEIGGISLESLQQHEYYRIISYAFLHASVSHFTFNMFAIIFFSPPIEKCLGSIKFIILFFATIIGTAFFTILTIFLMNYDFLSVGASGFGYGIFGVYIAIIVFKKTLIDKNSKNALLIFIGIAWLLTFTVGNVNIFGHLGGFIAGIIVGFLFLLGDGIKKNAIEYRHNVFLYLIRYGASIDPRIKINSAIPNTTKKPRKGESSGIKFPQIIIKLPETTIGRIVKETKMSLLGNVISCVVPHSSHLIGL